LIGIIEEVLSHLLFPDARESELVVTTPQRRNLRTQTTHRIETS
jgi:hypothetical protein